MNAAIDTKSIAFRVSHDCRQDTYRAGVGVASGIEVGVRVLAYPVGNCCDCMLRCVDDQRWFDDREYVLFDT